MTLTDFLRDTVFRYRTQPVTTATANTTKALARGVLRRTAIQGNTIWERGEWDVLVVLDACRTDLWRDIAPEYGFYAGADDDTTWSNAACSIDWITRNFVECPDEAAQAGYVTANPFADHDAPEARSADLGERELGYFAPLYRSEWGPIDGAPEIETTAPEPVTDHAIATWRRRDELDINRLVVHYMQPHQPYRSRPDWEGIGKNCKNLVDDRDMAGACAWQRARRGEIDVEELWAAVEDNLRWVLDDVSERLLPNLDGEVVLTADHGNGAGEFGEWAHPPGSFSPYVWRVPWCRVQCTDEGACRPDVELWSGSETDSATAEQLAALGYASDSS